MANVKGFTLLLLMMMIRAWKHSQNTIFEKSNEVIKTRSKWLITFVIDLNPYELLLNKMEEELHKLDMAKVRVTQKYIREEKYFRLLDYLELEIAIMEVEWKGMRNYVKGIELLQIRGKRAVVPIVEKALSVLFGIMTDDDVESGRSGKQSENSNPR